MLICNDLECDLLSCVQLLAMPWTVCSPPGSSVLGDSPGKNTGVGCHALLQGNLPNPGIKPAFLMYVSCIGRGSFSPLAPPGKSTEVM